MQIIFKMPHWLLVLYSFADFSTEVLTVCWSFRGYMTALWNSLGSRKMVMRCVNGALKASTKVVWKSVD